MIAELYHGSLHIDQLSLIIVVERLDWSFVRPPQQVTDRGYGFWVLKEAKLLYSVIVFDKNVF